MSRLHISSEDQFDCWTLLLSSRFLGSLEVDDYAVKAEAEGVRDTAAIRVAATLIPEGITGSPEEQRENGPRRKALFVGICYAGTSS